MNNLVFEDTNTKQKEHVYIIKIKIHDDKIGKKQDAARWMQWLEIKNLI